jgi:hypothetical protein
MGMGTMTLWLLIAFGRGYTYSAGASTPGAVVVERFATLEECQRVARIISNHDNGPNMLRCIQATVVKP